MVDIQHVLRQNVIKTTVCKTSLFHQVLASIIQWFFNITCFFPHSCRCHFRMSNKLFVDVWLAKLSLLWNKKKSWSQSGFCCCLVLFQISLNNAIRKCLLYKSYNFLFLYSFFYSKFIWPLATLLKQGLKFKHIVLNSMSIFL